MKRRLFALLLVGLLWLELLAGCGKQDVAPNTLENEVRTEDAVNLAEDSDEAPSKEESSLETSSGEDVFDWEKGQEQQTEKNMAWYESLTEEDFAGAKKAEDLTGDDWQQTPFLTLLGEFPELSIKIYADLGEGDRMILEHQGQRRILYKDWLTPRAIMPEFCVYDYDDDGIQEIGMICYVGSGTGVALMDFSIFDSVEEEFDMLYTMSYEEVLQVCDQVSLFYEEDVLRITAGDKSEEHSLSGTDFSELPIEGPALGDIIYFSFGESGEVICDVSIGLVIENQAMPFYLEEMVSDNGVVWENDAFRFYVHYDGKGGFEADGLTLAGLNS